MIFRSYYSFLEKSTLQPQIFNIQTVLACSAMDNQVILYVFWFGHSMHIEIYHFNARNTRAGNHLEIGWDSSGRPSVCVCVCVCSHIQA